ncbi:MAG: hypothetical protein JW741_13250 [Sedimentisphaerales bacterium]|nr:hypothetical protein [Sedimentisphaerales bacterium]
MPSQSLRSLLLAAAACLVFSVVPAVAEMIVFPVATTDDDETFPTVSGGTVVWQFYNSRYDDWDIRGAGISDTGVVRDFQITDVPGTDAYPMIDGNDVVWQHEYQPGLDWDIHAADISDRSRIVKYIVSDSADDERLPSVSGGVVVWQHMFFGESDWDILGAYLTGADDPEYFYVSATIGVNELFPCISGDLVVWNQPKPDADEPCVWGADISDPCQPRTFYTTMGLGEYEMPCISDGWIVGRDTDDVGRVLLDDLFDPFNAEKISWSGLTASPRIHGHLVVWQDLSNGTWDVRAYNRITREELVITDRKMSDQMNPSVYVDAAQARATIVWQDNRDGNWDIYAATLDTPEIIEDPGEEPAP